MMLRGIDQASVFDKLGVRTSWSNGLTCMLKNSTKSDAKGSWPSVRMWGIRSENMLMNHTITPWQSLKPLSTYWKDNLQIDIPWYQDLTPCSICRLIPRGSVLPQPLVLTWKSHREAFLSARPIYGSDLLFLHTTNHIWLSCSFSNSPITPL